VNLTWDACHRYLVTHCNPDPHHWPAATDRYAAILWMLSESLAVTNVLEIGIGPTSVSGMVFAHSMGTRGGGHLLSFDIEPDRPLQLHKDTAAGLNVDWAQVYGDSLVTLPAWHADRQYDLVYVDGDHDEAHAYGDTINGLVHLRLGGYLVIDDYPGGDGVVAAVRHLERDGYVFVHLAHHPPHGNGRMVWQKQAFGGRVAR
jgi:predicted O-methyltransferase YrrM